MTHSVTLSSYRFFMNHQIWCTGNKNRELNPTEICRKRQKYQFRTLLVAFRALKKTHKTVNLKWPHLLIFWSFFFFFLLSWLQQSHKGSQSPEDRISSHLFAAFFQLPAKLLAFSFFLPPPGPWSCCARSAPIGRLVWTFSSVVLASCTSLSGGETKQCKTYIYIYFCKMLTFQIQLHLSNE